MKYVIASVNVNGPVRLARVERDRAIDLLSGVNVPLTRWLEVVRHDLVARTSDLCVSHTAFAVVRHEPVIADLTVDYEPQHPCGCWLRRGSHQVRHRIYC